MGTNYYFRPYNIGSRRLPQEHIGKSSCGWRFLFHVTDTIKSADDWFKRLKNGTIISEYGEILSLEEFREMVNSKRFERNSIGNGVFHRFKYYKDRKYDYTEGEFC